MIVRIMSVVGARPQFVKLAAIAHAVSQTEHQHVIVHTGQHYDESMSDVFFSGLQIPKPDYNLGAGSDSHGRQTGAILAAMDEVLERLGAPDWVLVYGDTNSTIAAALSAVKLHIPVAHLEAGLRSFNRRMPEEHNRILTDHCADLLLAPTDDAAEQLSREGLGSRTIVVGDVMTDVLYWVRDSILAEHSMLVDHPQDPYLVATIHRAENTDEARHLNAVIEGIAAIPLETHLIAHPRLRAKAAALGVDLEAGGRVNVSEPLPYRAMVEMVSGACGVVTDSGGLQKEAYLLGVACTTIRTETEWTATLAGGWNVLCTDPAKIAATAMRPKPSANRGQPFGDGRAAPRVIEILAAMKWNAVPATS